MSDFNYSALPRLTGFPTGDLFDNPAGRRPAAGKEAFERGLLYGKPEMIDGLLSLLRQIERDLDREPD